MTTATDGLNPYISSVEIVQVCLFGSVTAATHPGSLIWKRCKLQQIRVTSFCTLTKNFKPGNPLIIIRDMNAVMHYPVQYGSPVLLAQPCKTLYGFLFGVSVTLRVEYFETASAILSDCCIFITSFLPCPSGPWGVIEH